MKKQQQLNGRNERIPAISASTDVSEKHTRLMTQTGKGLAAIISHKPTKQKITVCLGFNSFTVLTTVCNTIIELQFHTVETRDFNITTNI